MSIGVKNIQNSMALAPWRSPLSRALHRNRAQPESRYVQLATVDFQGRPTNRTVVFRGFRQGCALPSSDQLQFVSDRRSQKIEPIQDYPWGALCWYFAKTREQFRFSGPLALITADTPHAEDQMTRQTLWQSLSDNARLQFAWPVPGAPRGSAEAFHPSVPDPMLPLSSFCVLLLTPTVVEHLELRGEPQNRWVYEFVEQSSGELEGDRWSMRSVNP